MVRNSSVRYVGILVTRGVELSNDTFQGSISMEWVALAYQTPTTLMRLHQLRKHNGGRRYKYCKG